MSELLSSEIEHAAATVAQAVSEVTNEITDADAGSINTNVWGLGHDVVDVAAFNEQLSEAGTRMRGLFSLRELRQVAMRARLKNDGEAVHMAARWAGKEAVLKAWCDALGDRPYPYTLDNFPWANIEILDDSRGKPHVVFTDDVSARMSESLKTNDIRWHVSLSHDGALASAVALVVA